MKLVNSTLETEHLNLCNVLKSTIFTRREFQAFIIMQQHTHFVHVSHSYRDNNS